MIYQPFSISRILSRIRYERSTLMPKKHYVVTLTAAERSSLHVLIAKGKVAARTILHAQILLKTDAGPQCAGWKDKKIASTLEMGRCALKRLRHIGIEQSMEAQLVRKR